MVQNLQYFSFDLSLLIAMVLQMMSNILMYFSNIESVHLCFTHQELWFPIQNCSFQYSLVINLTVEMGKYSFFGCQWLSYKYSPTTNCTVKMLIPTEFNWSEVVCFSTPHSHSELASLCSVSSSKSKSQACQLCFAPCSASTLISVWHPVVVCPVVAFHHYIVECVSDVTCSEIAAVD